MNKLSILEDKELFSRLHLFWRVPIDSVTEYLCDCEEIDLPADTILISPKRKNSNLYILLSGLMEIRLGSDEAQALVKISVGDCVGEMSIIEHQNPSAFVVTVEDSRLLVLSREVLWSLVHASHGVSKNLLLTLSNRLRYDNKMISANKEMLRHVEEVAMIDALTGLFNRRWLNDKLYKIMNRCIHDNLSCIIVMADIDYFKSYNDNHGHIQGDTALRTVSKALKDSLRPNDMIARYGGEEFVILLPDTHIKSSMVVAERLRINVAKAKVVTHDKTLLPSLTISLGLAEMGANEKTEEKLLEAADKALYRAKNNGRNCISQ